MLLVVARPGVDNSRVLATNKHLSPLLDWFEYYYTWAWLSRVNHQDESLDDGVSSLECVSHVFTFLANNNWFYQETLHTVHQQWWWSKLQPDYCQQIISLTSLNMSSLHWAYWSSQTPSPYLRCWHSRLMIMRIMMIEISLQPAMMITIYILDILLHACCRHVLKVAIKCKKILLLSIIDNHQTRVFNNNCYWRLSFNSCSRQ